MASLLTIWFAAWTVLYSKHPIGVMNALLVEPREVSTQLEQQTHILTMKSP